MDKRRALFDLCVARPIDLDGIARFITEAELTPRDVTDALCRVAETYQSEVGEFLWRHGRAPMADELITTDLPRLIPLLLHHGLAETHTAMNSDGGERIESPLILLGWLDHTAVATACVHLLLDAGFDPNVMLREGLWCPCLSLPVFKTTKNTRMLLAGDLSYIRSDVPTAVTEEERGWLISAGVTTVLDLRTDAERQVKPCPLAADERFTYECHPITGGDRIPESPAAVPLSYIAMADARFDALIARLLMAETGVLYFCNAGKDRTGTVSAALLHRLGAERGEIVSDYMKSRDALADSLAAFAASTGVDLRIITPSEEYITAFLDWYENK